MHLANVPRSFDWQLNSTDGSVASTRTAVFAYNIYRLLDMDCMLRCLRSSQKAKNIKADTLIMAPTLDPVYRLVRLPSQSRNRVVFQYVCFARRFSLSHCVLSSLLSTHCLTRRETMKIPAFYKQMLTEEYYVTSILLAVDFVYRAHLLGLGSDLNFSRVGCVDHNSA